MNNRVKVAVLDTGIDKNHQYLKDNIIGGIAFKCAGEYIVLSDEYDDYHGHGTACSSIIKKEFEHVELFSIKALDDNGKTNIQILEESLKYILDTDIRLINLSLSVMNGEMIQDLYNICNELNSKGKIIVCSLANGFEESYPSIFNNVIGVKGFILEDENSFWYNKNEKIQCIVDNNSYLTCDIHNSYKLFGKSNSQAAAKLTGKIARILSTNPNISLEDLHGKLELEAIKNNWSDKDLQASKRYPDFKEELYERDNKHLIEIMNIVRSVLYIDKQDNQLYEYGLFSKSVGLNNDKCFDVIKLIEEKFNISLDYMNISRYDFTSIYTLTELVEKNLDNGGILI